MLSSATVDARFLELLVILRRVLLTHSGPRVPRAALSLHLMLKMKMEYAEQRVCTTGQSARDALNGRCQNNARNCLETLAGIVPLLS